MPLAPVADYSNPISSTNQINYLCRSNKQAVIMYTYYKAERQSADLFNTARDSRLDLNHKRKLSQARDLMVANYRNRVGTFVQ